MCTFKYATQRSQRLAQLTLLVQFNRGAQCLCSRFIGQLLIQAVTDDGGVMQGPLNRICRTDNLCLSGRLICDNRSCFIADQTDAPLFVAGGYRALVDHQPCAVLIGTNKEFGPFDIGCNKACFNPEWLGCTGDDEEGACDQFHQRSLIRTLCGEREDGLLIEPQRALVAEAQCRPTVLPDTDRIASAK